MCSVKKSNQEPLAIKIIDFEQTDDEVTEILQEVQFLNQVRSPHITQIHASFVAGTQLWIVMELCDAGSCAELYKYMGPLPEPIVAAVAAGALQGLVYLHADRTIHRDIKAANLLLTSRGAVKLSDFGVSARLTASLTRRRTFVGTPYWMAPEVIARNDGGYGTRADIWSLGATVFELLEGAPPLADMHPAKAIMEIVRAPAPVLPKWQRRISQSLKEMHKAVGISTECGSVKISRGNSGSTVSNSSRGSRSTNSSNNNSARVVTSTADMYGGAQHSHHSSKHEYSSEAHAFIDACLKKSPAQRPTALELLKHKFVASLVPMAAMSRRFRFIGAAGHAPSSRSSAPKPTAVYNPVAAEHSRNLLIEWTQGKDRIKSEYSRLKAQRTAEQQMQIHKRPAEKTFSIYDEVKNYPDNDDDDDDDYDDDKSSDYENNGINNNSGGIWQSKSYRHSLDNPIFSSDEKRMQQVTPVLNQVELIATTRINNKDAAAASEAYGISSILTTNEDEEIGNNNIDHQDDDDWSFDDPEPNLELDRESQLNALSQIQRSRRKRPLASLKVSGFPIISTLAVTTSDTLKHQLQPKRTRKQRLMDAGRHKLLQLRKRAAAAIPHGDPAVSPPGVPDCHVPPLKSFQPSIIVTPSDGQQNPSAPAHATSLQVLINENTDADTKALPLVLANALTNVEQAAHKPATRKVVRALRTELAACERAAPSFLEKLVEELWYGFVDLQREYWRGQRNVDSRQL